MGFLQKILHFFYKRRLEQDAKKYADTTRTMLNIKQAKAVGIIFDASKPDDIITINQYSDTLRAQGIKVHLLAYQNNKEKELRDSRFFNNLQINLFSIPQGGNIEAFQNLELDILICAFLGESLALEYIAATSNARFRVGAFHATKTNYFELMINTKQNQSLKYLLQQIDHFLKAINP
ncbi:MAG: hypothetical protein H6579_10800 [Chitinophagales bacterium]|nr:hypothetical protein [Chitinophagales bacterium]